MSAADSLFEAASIRIAALADRVKKVEDELTQFGGDNHHLRAVLRQQQEWVRELMEQVPGLLTMVQGFAQRLAALEIRFQNHVEGKPDDHRQRPHDTQPGDPGDGICRGGNSEVR